MSNVYYQHKVFTHIGTVMMLSGLRKSLDAGEDVRILAMYPSGIIAPARVKKVEAVKPANMWHLRAGTGRSINADLQTSLLTTEGWSTIDQIIPNETTLRVGPSAKHSMDAVRFAVLGGLRHEDDPSAKDIPTAGAMVDNILKSVYEWNGDIYAVSVTMHDVDNYIITSGIIVKSNGDN
jgi:hypothetical protein